MRAVAFALVALSLGAITPEPAAAQYRGPNYNDGQSGPPNYYTGRPPQAEREFEQPPPPPRRVPDERRRSYEPASISRQRVLPPSTGPDDRPPASYRRADRAPSARSNYQRFWDDGDGRGGRTTAARPAPIPRNDALPPRRITQERVAPERGPERIPERYPERYPDRGGGPVSHVAVGANQMVISIAEYESLQNQARELQRLRGTRRDFHDDGPTRDFYDGEPRRDYGPREIYR